MKRIKIAGMCLVVAVVVSATMVAAASASAPEYGRCLKVTPEGKVYKGGFKDSKCNKVAEAKNGKYEWFPGAVKKMQTTSGGKGQLETVTGLEVACESEASTGEYSGSKEVKNIVVTFLGCASAGFKCNTKGSAVGELVTKSLEGIVGFENKATKKTALDLFPAGKTGLFIEFACAGLQVSVRGSVLVPVTADKMETTGPLKYKATRGKQKPEHFEGQPNDVLESAFGSGPYEQSGQTITTTLKNEEPLELNAVV